MAAALHALPAGIHRIRPHALDPRDGLASLGFVQHRTERGHFAAIRRTAKPDLLQQAAETVMCGMPAAIQSRDPERTDRGSLGPRAVTNGAIRCVNIAPAINVGC